MAAQVVAVPTTYSVSFTIPPLAGNDAKSVKAAFFKACVTHGIVIDQCCIVTTNGRKSMTRRTLGALKDLRSWAVPGAANKRALPTIAQFRLASTKSRIFSVADLRNALEKALVERSITFTRGMVVRRANGGVVIDEKLVPARGTKCIRRIFLTRSPKGVATNTQTDTPKVAEATRPKDGTTATLISTRSVAPSSSPMPQLASITALQARRAHLAQQIMQRRLAVVPVALRLAARNTN